jgi:hypothetical protein
MTDWKLCPSCEGQAALRPFCDVCEGAAKVRATSPLFSIEDTPMIDASFRKILLRLAETREPVQPAAEERPLYDSLFGRRLLAYVYDTHRDGFVITADGRDLVSPHRQGAMR